MTFLYLIVVGAVLGGVGVQGYSHEPTQYHIQTDKGPDRYFRFQTYTGQYRKEKRLDDGTVFGTYGWVDPTGLLRLFDYLADEDGYRIVRQRSMKVKKVDPEDYQHLADRQPWNPDYRPQNQGQNNQQNQQGQRPWQSNKLQQGQQGQQGQYGQGQQGQQGQYGQGQQGQGQQGQQGQYGQGQQQGQQGQYGQGQQQGQQGQNGQGQQGQYGQGQQQGQQGQQGQYGQGQQQGQQGQNGQGQQQGQQGQYGQGQQQGQQGQYGQGQQQGQQQQGQQGQYGQQQQQGQGQQQNQQNKWQNQQQQNSWQQQQQKQQPWQQQQQSWQQQQQQSQSQTAVGYHGLDPADTRDMPWGGHFSINYDLGNQFHVEKTYSDGRRIGRHGYVDPLGILRVNHYRTDSDGILTQRQESRWVGSRDVYAA